MKGFLVTFGYGFISYLFLTMGSGKIFYFWSIEEIFLGFLIAIVVGFIAKGLSKEKKFTKILNPKRWLLFLVYIIGPFFFAMVKANLDVAYRILTKKINPGIVKISPDFKTDAGAVMLANSITLTPGTLSLEIDDKNEIYVHWINVTKKEPSIEDICGNFADWVKKITE